MGKKKDFPEVLAKALAQQPAGMDSQELLASLVRIWGGPDKLAVDIYAEFKAAAPGGMTRQRILEMIQRLIISNTERDLGLVRRPDQMSNEELADYADSVYKRLESGERPGIGAAPRRAQEPERAPAGAGP